MVKKSRIIVFLAICVAILTLASVFVCPQSGMSADAAAVSWKARVTYVSNGKYVDLPTGSALTASSQMVFLISQFSQNDAYQYYISDTDMSDKLDDVASTSWSSLVMGNKITIDGVEFISSLVNFASKQNVYIYFRRQYTENSSLKYENYPQSWRIAINTGLNENDLAFESITGTYVENSVTKNYSGAWLGSELTVTVKTKWMNTTGVFDRSDEVLSYSVDGKSFSDKTKSWRPMPANIAKLTESLAEARVDFRLTDIAGKYKVYQSYGTKVNLDTVAPAFSVNAMTSDINGSPVPYESRSWTSSDVVFRLTATANCISPVTYFYSIDGVSYERMETMNHTVRASVKGLRFRAQNAAGVIYEGIKDAYVVNIDNTRPGTTVDAVTPNPEDESKTKPVNATFDPSAFAYQAEYANGQITLRVYNKNFNGQYIDNKSGVKFYYAFKSDDGAFSDFREMQNRIIDGDNFYFSLTDTINSGVSSVRTYKFYAETGAGLRSNETTYTVTLLNSVFEIDVQEITYVPNSSGWSSTPVPVYVTVPTNSVILRNPDGSIKGYTEPTTKYTFYYMPTNISNALYSAEGAFFSHVENTEGLSVYRFYIAASAESTFDVYALNAAGKRSKNTFIGKNVIKIDVLKPETNVTAHIKPEDSQFDPDNYVYIASGEWVNGRIVITLEVKDGVSGVYVRDLRYAVDGNGNPVYDANGNLVWQESTADRPNSGSISGENGRFYIYTIEIGLPDASKVMMSEEYRFRIYTGSGVYKDISFIANIDTTGIVLEEVIMSVGEKEDSFEVNDNIVVMDSACEDVTVEFVSNVEQKGHFDFYVFNEKTGLFERVNGNTLLVEIPQGGRGTIVRRFYLVSRAKNYLGKPDTTSTIYPYELRIPYNTLNISINYELIGAGNVGLSWEDTNLTLQIGLLANDEGAERELTQEEKSKYGYYFMLIDFKTGLNIQDAINNGTWKPISNGSYITDGRYQFDVDFTRTSFYGYIALSVTNEAGYRSSTRGEVARLLMIDRTVPKIEDMIQTSSGIFEEQTLSKQTTYFSKDSIQLTPTNFNDRSKITYYYAKTEEPGRYPAILGNPTSNALNGWTKLERDIVLNAVGGNYSVYYYIFYAVNELGAASGGLQDGQYVKQYCFIIDPGQMNGNISPALNADGAFDPNLNMFAFIWKKTAKINVSVGNSATPVKYFYSMNDGLTWEPYLSVSGGSDYYDPTLPGGEPQIVELEFNENYFPDGVKAAFTFKAVNKAGTEYIYKDKYYIAIDTLIPEFEVHTTVNGVIYTGGNTTLSDVNAANWSNQPVTIGINMLKVNQSGVKLTYHIQYLINGTTVTSAERETPSKTSFTTDRLDDFNKNRDALVTIFATNRSDASKSSQITFRVKVDETIPEFSLTGRAYFDNSSEYKEIASGEWTNRPNVAVQRGTVAKNVSGVTYTYIREELDTSSIESNWPGSDSVTTDTICKFTVTARTDAGLSFVKVFQVNIDTVSPVIRFMARDGITDGQKYFIDLKAYIEEANIEICEYITTRGETRGFSLDPTGYVISTSSVDNSIKYDRVTGEEYRGYVKIIVRDYAGNSTTCEFYMLPFELDVNNVTLSDDDGRLIEGYEENLDVAEVYMDPSRVTYFRNLISRLHDRISTLRNEIANYQAYLEALSQRTSFELKSDYEEMFKYLETYRNYELMGQKWIQDAITGDASSKYYAYFQNFLVEFEKLSKEMAAVTGLEERTKKLPAVNVVKTTDYNDIIRVYDEHRDLMPDQKACFNSNLYTKLLALKKRCEILLLSDSKTGVKLDAAFAPGAIIRVETFAENSEVHNNVQKILIASIEDAKPHAVAAIYRVGLTGAASGTATGKVTITLPIPEKFRQYIYFAVYKYNTEGGAITVMNDMKIAGDGKSVTFTSDDLSTFVLCAKANVQINDEAVEEGAGTIFGIPLDARTIRTMVIIIGVLFGVVIIVVVIAGIRHRRFLNNYNRAYRSGIYRKGVQQIPKNNTAPRENPLIDGERVKTQKKPF